MTDHNPIHQSNAGNFATSRKGGVAADTDFILAQRSKGVPASAVARMIGRAETDVRLIYGMDCTAQDAPEAPTPALVWRQSKARAPSGKCGVRRPRSVASPLTRTMADWAKVIALEVAGKHGLTFDCLTANDDKRVFIVARREAWHAIYATGRCSLPMLGAWFGGRDHTTIRSGIRKHAETLAVLQADVEAWQSLGSSTKREAA